jgi:hypothetical protein
MIDLKKNKIKFVNTKCFPVIIMSNQHHNRNGPDTSLPAPIGAASAAETIARMDHLWKLSHTVFATHPILAAHYQSVLKTTAHLNG